jgi:hypothetical protein
MSRYGSEETPMKRLMLLGAVGAAMVGLTGCASTPATATSGYAYQTDFAKMSAVEDLARKRGVTVIWLNAPQKMVPVSLNSPRRPATTPES